MAKSTIDKSSEQEEFVAKFVGGKRTPRSGAGLRKKGDVADDISLFECKTSMVEKDSFTVKREWLDKIQKERFEDRKRFAFLVQNFGGRGDVDNYVVVRIEDFGELYNAYKEAIDEE